MIIAYIFLCTNVILLKKMDTRYIMPCCGAYLLFGEAKVGIPFGIG